MPFLLLIAVFAFLAQPARAQQSEYVILTGGVSLHQWEKYKAQPHDNWWLNFIRASRIRMAEIRQRDPNALITWLVYRPAYIRRAAQEGKELLSTINSVRDAYNVKLIYFDRTSTVVNYLNSGQNRSAIKIAHFEFFGHSNRACFLFDYSNEIDSASKVWLHENELSQINRSVFTRDAYVKSWGCHTGESFSQKWRRATGIPMWGAVGKTQYLTEQLPVISTPGGKWTR